MTQQANSSKNLKKLPFRTWLRSLLTFWAVWRHHWWCKQNLKMIFFFIFENVRLLSCPLMDFYPLKSTKITNNAIQAIDTIMTSHRFFLKNQIFFVTLQRFHEYWRIKTIIINFSYFWSHCGFGEGEGGWKGLGRLEKNSNKDVKTGSNWDRDFYRCLKGMCGLSEIIKLALPKFPIFLIIQFYIFVTFLLISALIFRAVRELKYRKKYRIYRKMMHMNANTCYN